MKSWREREAERWHYRTPNTQIAWISWKKLHTTCKLIIPRVPCVHNILIPPSRQFAIEYWLTPQWLHSAWPELLGCRLTVLAWLSLSLLFSASGSKPPTTSTEMNRKREITAERSDERWRNSNKSTQHNIGLGSANYNFVSLFFSLSTAKWNMHRTAAELSVYTAAAATRWSWRRSGHLSIARSLVDPSQVVEADNIFCCCQKIMNVKSKYVLSQCIYVCSSLINWRYWIEAIKIRAPRSRRNI